MKRLQLSALIVMASMLSGCGTEKVERLHSPCASAALDDSNPCGPKRPINDWWLNKANHNV
jgi:hypothetical protein